MQKIRGFAIAAMSAFLSSPLAAFAYTPDAGDEPGTGMTVLETVGFFVLLLRCLFYCAGIRLALRLFHGFAGFLHLPRKKASARHARPM